jgi:hypothetical protein
LNYKNHESFWLKKFKEEKANLIGKSQKLEQVDAAFVGAPTVVQGQEEIKIKLLT